MKIKRLILISLFAALICIATIIIPPIPIFSIPVTLQTLMIMITGILLTPKDAFLAVLLYLILGIIGLPVFSGFNSGLSALMGPTGGFLIAFPFASFFISYFKGKLGFLRLLIINAIFASLFVYLIGAISIAFVNQINYFNALQTLLIFIPIDLFKALMAALIGKQLKHISF